MPAIRNIGEGAPLLSLPLNRGSMSATRTGSRLAGVWDFFLFVFRGKDFCSQGQGPAFGHSIEVLADGGPSFGAVPVVSGGNQDLFYRFLVAHVSASPSCESKVRDNSSVTKMAFPGI